MRNARTNQYRRDPARRELAKIRGREVPVPTFYRWLDKCFIGPQDWYTEEHLNILKGLIIHIAAGGDVEEYQDFLIEEMKNAQSRNSKADQIIDIQAS